ncbi:MAG: sensor signal transduction histidine kinase [Chthonomonadales bacterium]|nr:sensor signal transduction histidine kinase [Chthonomonadales bacterium]
MHCPNCSSPILDNWRYCPNCGQPSSVEMQATGHLSRVVPSVLPVFQGELLESVPTALLFVTSRRRIGQINAAARAIFGIQENQDPLGKPFEEFVRHTECVKIIQRLLTRGSYPATDDEDTLKPDEISVKEGEDPECIYRIHASHIRGEADALGGTIFVFQDITDLRNGERRKPGFLSNIAYEMRIPLTPLKGFARTLLDDEKEEWYDRGTRREFYTIIDENVDRLSRLIDDLISRGRFGLAKIEMNWEEKVGLRRLTEEVVATQRGRTDKHTFAIDFEPADIAFDTDPDKIQNILRNIVSNAIMYAPNGGEIRIIARLKPADDDFPSGSVLIGVKDHGMGMSPKEVSKIGKMIHRTGKARTRMSGGTGIGLYLVLALVRLHQGTMTVESEIGQGSTFWVRLPLRQTFKAEFGLERMGMICE